MELWKRFRCDLGLRGTLGGVRELGTVLKLPGGLFVVLGQRTGREMAMQEQRLSVSWVRDAGRTGLELEDKPHVG